MAAARAQIKGEHRQELAYDWLLFAVSSTLRATVRYVCLLETELLCGQDVFGSGSFVLSQSQNVCHRF